MLLAGLAVAAIAVAAIVDFSITSAKVPEIPAACAPPGEPVCEEQRSVELRARLDRALDLQHGFEDRAWLYAAAALAAALAGLAVALWRADPARRREVFTDLGVASVGGLVVALILISGGDSLIETPTKPLLYPLLALLAIAAIGTLATPRAAPTGQPGASEPAKSPPAIQALVRVGLGLTALAVAAALLSFSGRDDPCTSEVPGWVDSLATAAVICAGLAILCGLAVLFARRWMAALVMLAVGPFAALVAALGTACWN